MSDKPRQLELPDILMPQFVSRGDGIKDRPPAESSTLDEWFGPRVRPPMSEKMRRILDGDPIHAERHGYRRPLPCGYCGQDMPEDFEPEKGKRNMCPECRRRALNGELLDLSGYRE